MTLLWRSEGSGQRCQISQRARDMARLGGSEGSGYSGSLSQRGESGKVDVLWSVIKYLNLTPYVPVQPHLIPLCTILVPSEPCMYHYSPILTPYVPFQQQTNNQPLSGDLFMNCLAGLWDNGDQFINGLAGLWNSGCVGIIQMELLTAINWN